MPKPATPAQVAAFVRDNGITYDKSATGTRCGILKCGLVHPSVGAASSNGKQSCVLFINGKPVPACVYCTAYLTDPHVQAKAMNAEKLAAKIYTKKGRAAAIAWAKEKEAASPNKTVLPKAPWL